MGLVRLEGLNKPLPANKPAGRPSKTSKALEKQQPTPTKQDKATKKARPHQIDVLPTGCLIADC